MTPSSTDHLLPPPQKNDSTTTLFLKEAHALARLALPQIITALLLHSRSVISTLFLGRLGPLPLAGGALAVAFANITGYSILSGLAAGMEPICSQSFGARRFPLLGLTLQRGVLLLLLASLPISLLWLNITRLLLLSGQDPAIAAQAHTFLLHSLPDLLALSLLHPLRIYLRSQSITLPLTISAAASLLLHLPINLLLVDHLHLGVRGVALGSALTNLNTLAFLLLFLLLTGKHRNTWFGFSKEALTGWKPLLDLAIPSCISISLEWWWYELIILLCGLLLHPKPAVAAMGILIQTTALIYAFPSSLSSSLSTRVGNEIGARRPDRAKFAALVGLSISFLLGLAALLFAVSVRNTWALMFTDDKEIIGLTTLVLPIIGLCELGNCTQTTGCGALRGTARPNVAANINLVCFYVVGMPVAVVLAFYYEIGFAGLWIGLLAAQGSCMVTMMVVLMRTDWEIEARRGEELTGEYQILDDDRNHHHHHKVKPEFNEDCIC
ncbi:Protein DETOXIFICATION 49 [Salvia divinorum]|uniref:Protein DETOXIFICATION n=1 Tax=Salvia divinorum TaxID=28513 RepID=A0ABD1FIG4_SALDI